MWWKKKNGMKKRVEGENASYCLLRCNREKPQELTKFARLFIIFSYKIIFDSFTAQLFIILSKNILNSFIKQPAQISDRWCSMTSKFSVIFALSLENCQECFLTNISHLRNEKGIQGKCPAEKIKKNRGWGEMSRREIWVSVVNVLGRWQCQDLCTAQVYICEENDTKAAKNLTLSLYKGCMCLKSVHDFEHYLLLEVFHIRDCRVVAANADWCW